MNTPVSFEIAKLLKEKRITIGGFKYYDNGGVLNHSVGFIYSNSGLFLAPTISEVVMWLYEKHGIWINVSITIQKEYYYQCLDITGKKDPTKNNYPSRMCKPGNYFNSPTEAYEVAIEYCLTNLI